MLDLIYLSIAAVLLVLTWASASGRLQFDRFIAWWERWSKDEPPTPLAAYLWVRHLGKPGAQPQAMEFTIPTKDFGDYVAQLVDDVPYLEPGDRIIITALRTPPEGSTTPIEVSRLNIA